MCYNTGRDVPAIGACFTFSEILCIIVLESQIDANNHRSYVVRRSNNPAGLCRNREPPQVVAKPGFNVACDLFDQRQGF